MIRHHAFAPAVVSTVIGLTSGSRPAVISAAVDLLRVPNGGIQPEGAVDKAGVVHLVYLAGDPGASNVYYVRSPDGGRTFTPAVRVNSQEGGAIATGTMRGAQIAVGPDGRVHIAWNGTAPPPPVNPGTRRAGIPMLYARSNLAGTAFEPQRNLMAHTTNLDGGGAIAADRAGGVTMERMMSHMMEQVEAGQQSMAMCLMMTHMAGVKP